MLKRLPLLLLLISFLGPQASLAQDALNWETVGPERSGGRVRDLAYSSDGVLWAASPGGGLWRKDDANSTWTPVDAYNKADTAAGYHPSLAASAIAIQGDLIAVGTGAIVPNHNRLGLGGVPSPRNIASQNLQTDNAGNGYKGFVGLPGQGVYISTDGGATFSNMNATWEAEFPATEFDPEETPWVSVQDLAINEEGRIFAATMAGVYFTDDNFQTVQKLPYPDEDPEDQATEDSPGEEFAYDIALKGDSVLVTSDGEVTVFTDNGNTYEEIWQNREFPRDTTITGANPPSKGLMRVAISPSNPRVIYVLETNRNGLMSGVWKSTNGGGSWTQIGPVSSGLNNSSAFLPLGRPAAGGDIAGEAQYASKLVVDPQNPDRIFLGGQRWYEYTPQNGWSTNNTRRFPLQPADPLYVPPNIHDIVFDPEDPNTITIATDLEVVQSTDDGNFFNIISSGLNIAPIYSTGVGTDGDLVSSMAARGAIYKNASGTNNFIHRTVDLEGNIKASLFNPSHFLIGGNIAGSNGRFRRSFDRVQTAECFTASPDTARLCNPTFGQEESFDDSLGCTVPPGSEIVVPNNPPLTPIALDDQVTHPLDWLTDTEGEQVNDQYMYTGNNFGVWLGATPFSTPTDPRDPPAHIRISDELPQGEQITALAVTPDSTHTLYAGTNRGNLFRISHAHNPCSPDFSYDTLTPPQSQYFWRRRFITSIAVHPTHTDTIAVTFGGYQGQSFESNPDCGVIYSSHIVTSMNAKAEDPEQVRFFTQHSNNANQALPYCPLYDVIFNPNRNRQSDEWLLAVGSEYGVYTLDSLKEDSCGISILHDWEERNSGELPRVPVFEFATRTRKRLIGPGTEYRLGIELQPDSILYRVATANDTLWRTQPAGPNETVLDSVAALSGADADRSTGTLFAYVENNDTTYSKLPRINDTAAFEIPIRQANNLIYRFKALSLPNSTQDTLVLDTLQNDLAYTRPNETASLYISTWGRGVLKTDIPVGRDDIEEDGRDQVADQHHQKAQQTLYPNPADQQLSIKWQLPQTAQAQVEVYDLKGQRVTSLRRQNLPAGQQRLQIDTQNWADGLYIIKTTLSGSRGLQQELTEKVVIQH